MLWFLRPAWTVFLKVFDTHKVVVDDAEITRYIEQHAGGSGDFQWPINALDGSEEEKIRLVMFASTCVL